MTSYQYAGNNPVMGNDPLGNVTKLTEQPLGNAGFHNSVGDVSDIDGLSSWANSMKTQMYFSNGDGITPAEMLNIPGAKLTNIYMAGESNINAFQAQILLAHETGQGVVMAIKDGQMLASYNQKGAIDTFWVMFAKDSEDPYYLNDGVAVDAKEASLLLGYDVGNQNANQGADESNGKLFDVSGTLDKSLNLTADMVALSQAAGGVGWKQMVREVPILKQLGVATGIVGFVDHAINFRNNPNWKDGLEMAGQLGVWGLKIAFPESYIVDAVEFGYNNVTMGFDVIWDHNHKQ